MIKEPKQCPHTNTVQVGDEKEVRTVCVECGEVILQQKIKQC